MDEVRAAAVQAAPRFLDRETTTEKVCRLIGEAAREGAGLIVFPEAFVPGYPDWVWRCKPWDDGAADWFGRLVAGAVVVPGPTTDAIGAAARQAGAYVVCGVDELEPNGGTVYNTLLFFGPDGSLLGKHRKLMRRAARMGLWRRLRSAGL